MHVAKTTRELSGYEHPAYAQSLAEFGMPRHLTRCGGWILERPIDGLTCRDAMGCYPLFACADWSGLQADLDDLADELVCISLVADPFGDYRREDLQNSFKDKFIPFKEHFVSDLRRPAHEFVSSHHRYYARRARENVAVERCRRPQEFLDDWMDLYRHLAERYHLNGVKAFSQSAFEMQLKVPGIVMLRATHDGKTVGAHLWYLRGRIAYSHLAATSVRGYELMAPYALHDFALGAFAAEADWIHLGGGAGDSARAEDGLTRFKRGWATGTRTAYFCGRIFDRKRYDEALAVRRLTDDNGYFPAYRKDELI